MTEVVKQKTKTLIMSQLTYYALLGVILIVAAFYIYFANMAVRTLTTLEKTKNQMQSLSVDVSEMESQRLAVENNISSALAKQLGFIEVQNPIFIVKNSNKTTLSLKID